MKRFIVLFYALFQSNVSVSIVISSTHLRISKDSPNILHWNYGHNADFTFDRFQPDWLLKFYKFQSLPIQSNDLFEKGKFIIIDRFTPKLIIIIDKFAILLCSLKFFEFSEIIVIDRFRCIMWILSLLLWILSFLYIPN